MNTDCPIRVALADDHALFRAGLKSLLSEYPDIEIVAEAGNGEELIEVLNRLTQPPDICLLDIQMPKMNGYETISHIVKKWPSIGVIALSVLNHDYAVADMVRRGARAFLPKDSSPSELHSAVKAVHHNGHYYDNITGRNFNRLIDSNTIKLTPKEKEFLILCCSDKRYQDIAELMSISVHTANGYRDSLFRKLEVNTRAGLVIFAMHTGLA